MTQDRPLSPAEQVRRAYETTERRTAQTLEDMVSTEGFSEMLAMMVGNAMSLTKMSSTVLDDVVRRTHLAGRSDLSRVGRQLARTEDKLELLLQHIEHLEDEMAELRAELAVRPAPAARTTSARAVSPRAARAARAAAIEDDDFGGADDVDEIDEGVVQPVARRTTATARGGRRATKKAAVRKAAAPARAVAAGPAAVAATSPEATARVETAATTAEATSPRTGERA